MFYQMIGGEPFPSKFPSRNATFIVQVFNDEYLDTNYLDWLHEKLSEALLAEVLKSSMSLTGILAGLSIEAMLKCDLFSVLASYSVINTVSMINIPIFVIFKHNYKKSYYLWN